ncbi:MAG TPA: Crp/Fnr family transcriptional regulator [Chloroflexota bacterium]|jgi:CRP-like cAMP-binding protein
MPSHSEHRDPRRNYLLSGLPAATLDRLIPHLEPIRADQGDVLVQADRPVERVFFPTSGLFSLIVRSSNGDDAVEAAVAGREGMLGSAVILGAPTSTFEELCQVEDGVLALPAAYLQRELEADVAVRSMFLGYVAALLHATARTVSCNRLHGSEQRLARWLLVVRDRAETDTFYLTQQFLGQMLGVRRPTVTEAMQSLEEKQLIRHQRGRIRLVDTAGLEQITCEDYARIRDAYLAYLAR